MAVLGILERVGAPRLMGLLSDLGAGGAFDRAFTSWVQMPFADFEHEWLESLRAAARHR
jgi:hypothetical protein